MSENLWLKSYLDVADQLMAAGYDKSEAECLLNDAFENEAAQTRVGLIVCTPHVGYELDTSALEQPYAGDGVFADND